MTNPDRQDAPNVAFEWWNRLTSQRSGHQRAAIARMKRAATPIEVMYEPEALRLIERLPRDPDRVATLAGVLAWVGSDDSRPVARAVGRSSLDDSESADLSEARFRRILQTPPGDLMDAMRRLVRVTKGKANVRDLSVAVLYWGHKVRQNWIFNYYNVNAGRPEGRNTAPGLPPRIPQSEQ